MDVKCPECGSRQFVKFNGQFLCCSCSREFGPKCPECGTEMDPYNGVWICSSCHCEVESSEIELPKVDPEVYMRAFRNAKSKKPKPSSGSKKSFLGLLWDTICDDFVDMLNSAKK